MRRFSLHEHQPISIELHAMPINCAQCDHAFVFDATQARPPIVCPSCGGRADIELTPAEQAEVNEIISQMLNRGTLN